jgi:hypothetical protein
MQLEDAEAIMRTRDEIRFQASAFWPVALVLALCSSAQTAIAGRIATTATHSLPAATMTIVRSQDELYHALRAVIDLNGKHVATLAPGQTYSQSLPIGPTVLIVSSPPLRGKSTLHFSATSGSLFQFLVTPRIQNARSKMDNGIAKQLGEGAGPFIIVPVDVD